VAISVVALAVAGLPVVESAPASAVPSGAPAAVPALALVPCLTDLARFRSEPDLPVWRHHGDTTPVTERDLDALTASETRPGFVAKQVAPRLPRIIGIPTYVHVIKGKHKGERTPAGPKRVRRLINILNNGMAGNQNRLSAATRYRFTLKRIDYTKRDGWYHAFFNGPRDQRMKRKLHVGNARTLNVYINGGGPTGYSVLGWSRFPWQYRSAPYLDGVSVNAAAMPGGKARGYNLGDTLIHETGHWLGLFHTFQGGCGARGDLVSDTAAEGEPSLYCETTRDTCPAPGLDPVRNFMDYSQDACMNLLTPGQVRRMDSAFEKWRL
jgi:hypothetical protein